MASSNQFITMQTLSSAASSAGQTNTLNVPGTPTATVVQVGTKGAVSSGQHAIIQQNGQQFILTGKILTSDQTEQGPSEAISLPNNPQTVQTVYPVQYIDTSDPTIYTTGNGQIQYQEYAPMYATPVTAAAYYQTNGDPISVGQVGNSSTQSTNSVQGLSAGTQIVTHQGNTFLVQGTAASLDGESAAITHTTRASPATVQWLIDNYETAEGVSLPRSTLYNHYLRHCQEQKIDPMNPASFGKLIRSVFLGLRTRRLGTRGNSKYHYYGIRIKPTSSLNQFSDDQIYPSIRHYPHAYHKQKLSGLYRRMFSANRLRKSPSLSNSNKRSTPLSSSSSSSHGSSVTPLHPSGVSNSFGSGDVAECGKSDRSQQQPLRPTAHYPYWFDPSQRKLSQTQSGNQAYGQNWPASSHKTQEQQNSRQRQQIQLAKLHERLTARRMLLYHQNKTVKSLERILYDCDDDDGDDECDYDCEVYDRFIPERTSSAAVPLPNGLVETEDKPVDSFPSLYSRYKAFNGPKFEPSGSTSDYNSHVGTTSNLGSSALGVGSSSGPSAVGSGTSASAGNGPAGFGNNVSEDPTQHQQFLGDASSALPQFADIMIPDGMSLPPGITKDNLENFTEMYQEHCEMILDSVVNLQFTMVEQLWQQFWRINPPQVVGSMMNIDMNSNDSDTERRLQKDTLYLLIEFEPVRQYVRRCDYTFYHSLVEVLIPDVLRPIPSSLTQAIRNFAKSLEGWMRSCFKGLGKLLSLKLAPVCALAQTLRRYTSLNHLAQAARAVLQNTSQINQMLTDLNRVDFANVQEQASWVAHCSDATVTQIEQNFKKILQQQTSLEQWATWLDEVVTTVLHPHEKKPEFPRAARQFLLKWSFYSSMVIRDLTLRSAASFGSFHLIRLLYDEYMFYLIEHKVADHLGQPPVAVMGEFGKTHDNAEVPNTRMETFDSPTVNSTNSAAAAGNITNVSGATVMGSVNPTGLSTSGSSVSGDQLNLSSTSELLATPNLTNSVMIVTSSAATSGHNQPPNMTSSGLISLGHVASTNTTSASGTISHSDAVAIKENDFQDLLAQHELVDTPGRDSPPTVAASGLTAGVSGIQSVSFPKSVTVTTGDEGQSIQVLLHGPTVSAAISAAGGQTSSTSTSTLNAAIVPSVGTTFAGNLKSTPSVAIGALSANDATTVIAGKRIKLSMGD